MTQHHGKFVSYLRVSTQRQGESGLGLEAQRAAVETWLNGGRWQLVKEFVEVERGKRADNRPALALAFDACRAFNAKLVISRLDRLSRDAHFLLGLEQAGVEFVAADMPHANRLTVGIMAMVAEEERRAISSRTKRRSLPPPRPGEAGQSHGNASAGRGDWPRPRDCGHGCESEGLRRAHAPGLR